MMCRNENAKDYQMFEILTDLLSDLPTGEENLVRKGTRPRARILALVRWQLATSMWTKSFGERHII
jgi:hypothetical protein